MSNKNKLLKNLMNKDISLNKLDEYEQELEESFDSTKPLPTETQQEEIQRLQKAADTYSFYDNYF